MSDKVKLLQLHVQGGFTVCLLPPITQEIIETTIFSEIVKQQKVTKKEIFSIISDLEKLNFQPEENRRLNYRGLEISIESYQSLTTEGNQT